MNSTSEDAPTHSKVNRRARKPVETSSDSEEDEAPSSRPAFRPRVKKSKNPASYPTESLFQPTEHVYVCDLVDGKVFSGPFVIHKIDGEEKYALADATTGKVVKDNVLGEKLRDGAQ